MKELNKLKEEAKKKIDHHIRSSIAEYGSSFPPEMIKALTGIVSKTSDKAYQLGSKETLDKICDGLSREIATDEVSMRIRIEPVNQLTNKDER